MKVIISKKEIQANNSMLLAILANLDMVPGEKKRILKDAIARMDEDFKGVVEDLQKKSEDAGEGRKVSFRHHIDADGVDGLVVMELDQDYYVGHLNLLAKYAKPLANIANGLYGLLVAFKGAVENFSFIMKGYEVEAKKLESDFSSKKD